MTLIAEEQRAVTVANDSDVVLSVQGVSKKFCRDFKRALFYGVSDISQEILGLRGDVNDKLRKQEFWALQDVSFELRRGEALGLVGKNGSGKSTLLRIIAGLIKPDVGSVTVKGRVAPLIALGAGFNPVLTGRENIYANMSILGLSKAEIDDLFDDVVAFAEIPDAIDSPVRSYSSGMQARLGFACAIHTEPDILLIDEVLAVGDIRFQAKCHTKLSKLRDSGTSFILVSHNSQVIAGVCESGVYLNEGIFIDSGEVDKILEQYERDLILQDSFNKKTSGENINRSTTTLDNESDLSILSIELKDKDYKSVDFLNSSEPAKICIKCKSSQELKDIVLRINFYEKLGAGNPILFLTNLNDGVSLNVPFGKSQIVINMPKVCFKPGRYIMKTIIRQGRLNTLDYFESYDFTVMSNVNMSNCAFYQEHSWELLPSNDL